MRNALLWDIGAALFLLAAIVAMALMPGCNTLGGGVTSEFSETVEGVTTTYRAESKAGLFGELETSNHDFRYQYEGGEIAVGQSGQGLDNTGNTAALAIAIQGLVDLAKTRVEMEALKPPDPAGDDWSDLIEAWQNREGR